MSGRLLAVGDIHGCDRALELLLKELALKSEDTLVVLGDVVDRGPNTRQVIDRLLELRSVCHVEFILGNHEEMLLGVLDDVFDVRIWSQHGGREVLENYGGDLRQMPQEHVDFLRAGYPWVESPTALFVHANLEPGIPLDQQTREWLRWTRLTGMEPPWPTGQRVVCGHTPQASGQPWVFRGWACIDTNCVKGRWLTCLDVLTDEIFQSNEQGEFQYNVLGS